MIVNNSHTIRPERTSLWQFVPLTGCILFAVLYFIATLYYPGGNYADKTSKGFSWTENYWCNLLSENALNGQYNTARPIAFSAMAVICLTMIVFWYIFPAVAGFGAKWSNTIRACGALSMLTGIFLFTSWHDNVINIAGLFGLVALAGTLTGLKKLGWTMLLYMGMIVVLLVGLNNLLYYQKSLMHYLAVVQKITFAFFLLWICMINARWLRRE